MKMKGLEFWHTSSGSSEIRETGIPDISRGEVLVQSHCSLISVGTERIVAQGMVPESIMDDMRVPYMRGDFTFPCTYGYSLVGKIVDGNDEHVGKKVHVMHPHQNYAVVKLTDVFFIPEEFPLTHAVLASNMETALTAFWDSEASIGDEVLLVGFGTIGALLAGLLKSYPHIRLQIIEKDEERLQKAQLMGLQASGDGHGLESRFDVAFNCSGSAGGLQLCINKTGFEGRVVELSWYGKQQVSLHLGHAFHSKRKKIISSQVSSIPAFKRNRWDYRRRKQLVFDMLKDPYYGEIITNEVSFEQAPSLFQNIRRGVSRGLGIMISY
jgi:threonine dehydrogenase-like Zn-dependent dehydrogenase